MFQRIKNVFHAGEAIGGNIIYGFPGKKLKIIGVTGTDGKTTTTSLIYHILRNGGKKVSMMSTVSARLAGTDYDTGFHVTTPGRHMVPKYLGMSVKNGDEYFVLEMTSHAIDQNRAYGIQFEAGLITNVTHEHLDYHKTYDNYVQAKTKLLLRSKIAIANHDDGSYPYIKAIMDKKEKPLLSYGIVQRSDFMTSIAAHFPSDIPQFNKYNYLAAYSVCKSLGIEENVIFEAMKTYELPQGRIDKVFDGDFKVIVDFAHTPNALDQILGATKHQMSSGKRLIHVFGAAGLRDRSKRPLMGESSGKWADNVIITEEDYRIEDPVEIAESIAEGLIKHQFELSDDLSFPKKYSIIIDRQKAIAKAIEIARTGDVVLITGKGHEKSLCRGKKEYPWNDREAIVRELDIKIA
jgi:UDP-N-acetylmuramoyl-L-alanyl-D-glutamate--2,6-diaminopimelate ligase